MNSQEEVYFSCSTKEILLTRGESWTGSVLTPATYRLEPVSVNGQERSEEQNRVLEWRVGYIGLELELSITYYEYNYIAGISNILES